MNNQNARPTLGEWMGGYGLQPGESFVHKQERVRTGGGLGSFGFTDELILTSQNLVLVKKGMFGNGKGVRVFPLNTIKVFQGQAQAVVGKKDGWAALDVYFDNGTEQFVFEGLTKKDATFWSQKINEVVTGAPAKVMSPSASAAELAAGAMKDTVGAFKDAFGLRSKTELAAAAAAVPIAGSCARCGAPISGIRGQAVTCDYCDSDTQL